MTRRQLSMLLAGAPFLAASRAFAVPQAPGAVREEASEHPRIANAIRELKDAIDYMEHAPHDFGGHKEAALRASREAIVQLRKALAYRARAEGRH